MSDKPTWSLAIANGDSEAALILSFGDLEIHITDLPGFRDFWLSIKHKGTWQDAPKPLWQDLRAAMDEAERICRIESHECEQDKEIVQLKSRIAELVRQLEYVRERWVECERELDTAGEYPE